VSEAIRAGRLPNALERVVADRCAASEGRTTLIVCSVMFAVGVFLGAIAGVAVVAFCMTAGDRRRKLRRCEDNKK